MTRNARRPLSPAATVLIAGVVPGLVLLLAVKVLFTANAAPLGAGSLFDVFISSVIAICIFVGGRFCFSLVRLRRTPDLRVSPPDGALIEKVRDAGIPADSIVVRDTLTVTVPSCGKPDGAGWVTVIGLAYNGDDRSWLVCYFLTGKQTGRDPLVFMEQIYDDQTVAEQLVAAYRGDEMAWQGKKGDP